MKLESENDKKLASEGYKALKDGLNSEKSDKRTSRTVSRKAADGSKGSERYSPGGKRLERSSERVETSLSRRGGKLVFRIGKSREVQLPRKVAKLLIDVLEPLSKGEDVKVVTSSNEELTTQGAANYLHVSRPYLIGLLDRGEIPHRKVGKHRRIPFEDLKKYKEGTDEKRMETLAELTRQAQELGMGYK